MREDMMAFWDAVASAGPYANNMHLAQMTTTTPHHSIFTGQMFFLTSNQQYQSTEGMALLNLVTYLKTHVYTLYTTAQWDISRNRLSISPAITTDSPVLDAVIFLLTGLQETKRHKSAKTEMEMKRCREEQEKGQRQ